MAKIDFSELTKNSKRTLEEAHALFNKITLKIIDKAILKGMESKTIPDHIHKVWNDYDPNFLIFILNTKSLIK